MFRFRTVWTTGINLIFILMKLSNLHNSPLNVQSTIPIKKIIFNSCAKKVPMKQLTIVLEKCFSKCLDGASNADRGNPVYSQDKSAPAWPIHTPSSTAPYITNTKYKKKYKMEVQKNTECKRLFGFLFHPFSPPPVLGLPSLLVLRLRFSASLNVFFLSTTNSSSPFYLSVIF